jgi:translation initiation factor 1
MAKGSLKDQLMHTITLVPEEITPLAEKAITAKTTTKKQDLIIRFEKRNGKPATIVSNFQGSEAELKDMAGSLKKHCGVGGSAKDDEILIQGDVRKKVSEWLTRQGYKVRGDFR